MRKAITIAVLLGFGAAAYAAVGDSSEFSAARDWTNMAGDASGYMNAGLRNNHRAYKNSWQEAFMADWYKPAVGGNGEVDTIQDMKDWMAAEAPGEGETFRFQLYLFKAWGWDNGWPEGKPITQVRYEVRTVNLQEDWAEGDGVSYFDFNWSKDIPAATNWYAQTYYTDTDGVPGGQGPNGQDEVLDTANCVQWTNYAGLTSSDFQSPDVTLLRHMNGVYDKNQDGDLDDPGENEPIYLYVDPVGPSAYVSVDLQYDPDHPYAWHPCPVVNDLLDNPLNRGLILGRGYYWDDDTQAWEQLEGLNGVFYTLDQNNLTQEPYIEITHLPRPGDATGEGDVDGADYTVWADHYSQTGVPAWADGGWTLGNWTADDVVDGADYTVWADNYASTASQAPEPACLTLMALGALGLARRRRT